MRVLGACDTSSQETSQPRQTARSQTGRTAPCDLDAAGEILGALEGYQPQTPRAATKLCEKAAPLIAEQEARQEALQNPPKPKTRPEPSPLYVKEGIYGQREVNKGPPSEFKYENLGRGVVKKQNIAVFAGAKKDDPTHAVISACGWATLLPASTRRKCSMPLFKAPSTLSLRRIPT